MKSLGPHRFCTRAAVWILVFCLGEGRRWWLCSSVAQQGFGMWLQKEGKEVLPAYPLFSSAFPLIFCITTALSSVVLAAERLEPSLSTGNSWNLLSAFLGVIHDNISGCYLWLYMTIQYLCISFCILSLITKMLIGYNLYFLLTAFWCSIIYEFMYGPYILYK